jgi:transposase
MNIHKNARLTPLRREEMALAVIEGRLCQAQAALQFAVTAKVVKRWVTRYQAEGRVGMADRSSRPRHSPNATDQAVADQIVALRRQRFTAKHIASVVAVSPATVSRVLARAGLSRLKDLEPAEPVRRYEREKPGDMIHIDIKKLGRFDRVGHRITGDHKGQSNSRGIGWEFVHVCIDDASRVAFSRILPDERKESAVAFLDGGIGAIPYLDAQPLGLVSCLGQRDVPYRAEADHLRLAVDPVSEQPASGALVPDLEIEIVRHPVHAVIAQRIDLPCGQGALAGHGRLSFPCLAINVIGPLLSPPA